MPMAMGHPMVTGMGMWCKWPVVRYRGTEGRPEVQAEVQAWVWGDRQRRRPEVQGRGLALATDQTNCMNEGWKARSPLHFELPVAPEKPIDLQITAAAPELRPLLQIGAHAPSNRISGRPVPPTDGDPSSALHVQAKCWCWGKGT